MPTKQTEVKQHTEGGQAISIVLIETNGTIKTLKTKEVSPETLYKKCGFRVNDDFLCRHTWQVKLKGDDETMAISIWAKKTGKANFENKYDLPPPLDKELFFGTCAIVRTIGAGASGSGAGAETFVDLTKETWLKVYEQLFGGFEDIGDEDEYSEDELENVDPSLLTAHGYLKDDFVVSDKDALELGEVSTEEEIEVVVVPVKKKRVSKSAADKPIIKKAKDAKSAPAKSAPAKSAPAKSAPAKSAPAKSAPAPAKPTKSTAQKKSKAKKPAVEKTEEEEEAEEDVSELEEEVYTFSDDD